MANAISLRPSDAQQGGFLDDADVVFKECRFVVWDYMGKADKPSVALKISMEDPDGNIHDQYYSAGDVNKVTPTPDGKTLEPIGGGTATGLNANTNALAFIASIINAGYPEDRVSNDASAFDGMGAHVNQVAQPKRAGLKGQKENATYLLVTKITRLPWEAAPKPVAKGAPAPKPAPVASGPKPVPANSVPTPTPSAAPSTTEAPSDAVVEKARATVLQVLMEKGGAVPRAKLPTECFRVLTNDPDRNAIVTLVFKEEFLQAGLADSAFGFDGTTVSLP